MNTPKITFSDASYVLGSVGIRSWDALARWDNISVVSTAESAIHAPENDGGIFLYPNPVNDCLSVNVPQDGCLSVYDSTGRQLFSASVPQGITTLNTGDYGTGIYFLQLVTGDSTSCVRFLKNG
jgi:hypothetical protein